MIHGEGDFSGSIKEDCIFTQSVIDAIVVCRSKHENNSFLKHNGGVGGAHSSATDCPTRNQSLTQSSGSARNMRIILSQNIAAVWDGALLRD